MDKELLMYYILKKKITLSDFVKKIQISKSAFYRKLNKQSEFTRHEIELIANVLQLDNEQIVSIFFGGKVS